MVMVVGFCVRPELLHAAMIDDSSRTTEKIIPITPFNILDILGVATSFPSF